MAVLCVALGLSGCITGMPAPDLGSKADAALGTFGGPCYGNGTCNSGMTCELDRCVKAAVDRDAMTDSDFDANDCGTCAKGEICVEGACYKICAATKCNEQSPDCAKGETCASVGVYSICFPTFRALGDPCSSTQLCSPRTLCVGGPGPTTCRRACTSPLDCSLGETCTGTSAGVCWVCVTNR